MSSTVESDNRLGFPSAIGSPNYVPLSPGLSESRVPTNNHVINVETYTGPKNFLEIEVKSNRRKRKSTKQRAEEQFDVSAAPISILKFAEMTIDESQSLDIDINNDEKVDSSNKCMIEDKELAENCALVSLIIAKDNVPDELSDNELIIGSKTPDNIDTDYFKSLIKSVNDLEPNKEKDFNPPKRDKFLYFERRLIQSLQLRNVSSPEFIKTHFPIQEKLFEFDIKSIYTDSRNSLLIIKSMLQNICESEKQLKDIFFGYNWIDKFRDAIDERWLKNRRKLQIVAICSYFIFFHEDRDYDRSQRLIDIDQKMFGNSKFRYFSIKELFSYLGINFISDYCVFPFYRDRILNSFLNSHSDVIEILEKEKVSNANKVRKRREDTFSNLGLRFIPSFLK